MAAFDPYHKWLGIPPAEQPVNHYRLLGVALFESDPDVIDAATEQRVSYLRQCATGQHIAESQKLLNEVAAARLCLLNSEKKHKYDHRLKQSLTPRQETGDPIASPATPIAMPWEGADSEPVDDTGVPDFNSTVAKSQGSTTRTHRASSVVTPARIAVGSLFVVVLIVLVVTVGQRDRTGDINSSQSNSQPSEISKSISKRDLKTKQKDALPTMANPTDRDNQVAFVTDKTAVTGPANSDDGIPKNPSPTKPENDTPTTNVAPSPTENPPSNDVPAKVDGDNQPGIINLITQLRSAGNGGDTRWKITESGIELGQPSFTPPDMRLDFGLAPPPEYTLRMRFHKTSGPPTSAFVGMLLELPVEKSKFVSVGIRQMNDGTARLGILPKAGSTEQFGEGRLGASWDGGLPVDSQHDLEIEVRKTRIAMRRAGKLVYSLSDFNSVAIADTRTLRLVASPSVCITVSRFELEPFRAEESDTTLSEYKDRFSKPIEKAITTRETAQKKAAAELLTAIDREIELARKKKLDANAKTLLIQTLTTERRAFENRSQIPWAPALRKATIEYLKDYNAADKPVAQAYDAAISHFTKTRDDSRAAALQQEKENRLTPWMIGTWEINNRVRKLVHVIYSNGKINEPAGKDRFEFTNDKLVLYYDTPNSATGAWMTQCTISEDGQKMNAKEQNGVTSPGQRVDNPAK